MKKLPSPFPFLKRFIDIVISLIALFFLPLIAIIIKILNLITGDLGPVFYAQTRIGKNGKHFRLIKFRTMREGADERLLKQLLKNPDVLAEWKKNHKLKDDPRITRIGKILRKTSIDETPQFINIFLGQMSLIGPRPLVKEEIEEYKENKEKLLSIRPGLTGWWACNGRSDTTPEKRRKLELYYVNNYSFTLDIKCFFKTIVKVLSREGAE